MGTGVERRGSRAPIRVLVVDDHPLMREGVRRVLSRETAIEVVGEAGTGSKAVQIAEETGIDVVVLDYRLPDADGIEVLRRLRETSEARVVFLSAFDDECQVSAAMENGASGYLTKREAEVDHLVDAVMNAHKGYATFSRDACSSLAGSISNRDSFAYPDLTPREREVWALLAAGMTNEAIARDMFLSIHTVKFHVANLRRKIGAANRAEAAVLAHRSGFAG